jgi:hypothetical protein
MADSRPLLDRLLNTPDLAKIVPHLEPDVLHRVIQRCGLEDCAELVALARPEQIARILDVDIWRARTPGIDETFDADRFGVWIDVLMDAGAAVAAEKLIGLDIELAIAGFSRLAAVFEHAAVSSFTTLDGEQRSGRPPHGGSVAEIGGYLIEATRPSAWDATVELFVFLDAEHPEYFHRLMRGCVRLSNGPREADGFHHLLEERDQDMFDLACDREARREQQGYVTPAQARAFLQAARELRLDADRPPPSPVARAYFRAIALTQPADPDAAREASDALPASIDADTGDVDADTMVSVIEVLRDAGVLTQRPRALLEAPEGHSSRLALIEAHVELYAESAQELAYLANAMVAGCTIQDRPFTPQEAADAVVAICNLGLENWPPKWPDRDLITAFQVGWTALHRDVCLYVAEHLINVVASLRCKDRDIQLRLHALTRELARHLRDGAPWCARHALEVLVMLDAPSWAALLALIDECPVMHAAVARRDSRHTISVGDLEFISHSSQINSVRVFMKSLPSTLTR